MDKSVKKSLIRIMMAMRMAEGLPIPVEVGGKKLEKEPRKMTTAERYVARMMQGFCSPKSSPKGNDEVWNNGTRIQTNRGNSEDCKDKQ